MGKKYIIEIGRLERLYKASVNVNGKPNITWLAPEVDLTPYTEPDLEQIKADWYKAGREAEKVLQPDLEQVRKEAYEKGYETGYKDGYNEPGKNQQEAYQRGLNDAWECARKVSQVRKYGGYGDCLEEVFGRHRVPWDVFDYPASEAIEKIRQYEQEKEEQIQVGDEVIYNGTTRCVVYSPENDKRYASIIDTDGVNYSADHRELTKTGRHFPEIAEVLQKMKES